MIDSGACRLDRADSAIAGCAIGAVSDDATLADDGRDTLAGAIRSLRAAGECNDFRMSRDLAAGSSTLLPVNWRTDTFQIGSGTNAMNGYCAFRTVNPCPCDLKNDAAIAAVTAERLKTRQTPCFTRADIDACHKNKNSYCAAACGGFDRRTFIRTDASDGKEVDTGYVCVASDYKPNGETDPYRGRVSVTVNRIFAADNPTAIKNSAFASGMCRKIQPPVRDASGAVTFASDKKGQPIFSMLCSTTPVLGSDARPVKGTPAPPGTSNNDATRTAFSGLTRKGVYPVHAIIEVPQRSDAAGNSTEPFEITVANLPACPASKSGANVTAFLGSSIRIRMDPEKTKPEATLVADDKSTRTYAANTNYSQSTEIFNTTTSA